MVLTLIAIEKDTSLKILNTHPKKQAIKPIPSVTNESSLVVFKC